MPRGFGAIKKAASKMRSGEGGNVVYLKLPKDGDSATVRFLEEGDDVYSYYYHDFSNLNKSEGWKSKTPCLDQEDDGTPCPGCELDLPRKFQGLINIIWRNGPVYDKDDEGNIDWDNQKGTGDVLAVWRQGITVFNKTLARKDVTYKGIGSRDFEIVRDGSGLQDTTYSVEPVVVDGETKAVPMSKTDKELAKDKHDLEAIAGQYDYDETKKFVEEKIAEFSGGDDDDDEDVSEFLKKEPFNDDE